MKINPTVGSMLNGLGKFAKSQCPKSSKQGSSCGYDSLAPFTEKPENRQYALGLGDLVNILVNILQVVVVTSSGLDSKLSGSAEIDQWPSLLAAGYDILTAGAVRPRHGLFKRRSLPLVKRWAPCTYAGMA